MPEEVREEYRKSLEKEKKDKLNNLGQKRV